MRTTRRIRSRTHCRRNGKNVTAVRGKNVTAVRGGNVIAAMSKLIEKLDRNINGMKHVYSTSPETRILNLIIDCENAIMKYHSSTSTPDIYIHPSHMAAIESSKRIREQWQEEQRQRPPSRTAWMNQSQHNISNLPPRPPSHILYKR
jgi:hypothetical protein